MFRLVLFLLLVLDSHLFRCLIFCFHFFFFGVVGLFFVCLDLFLLFIYGFISAFLSFFVSVFVFVWLAWFLLFALGFVCLLPFIPPMLHILQGLDSQAWNQAWAPVMGAPSCWTTREIQAPGNINWCEFSLRSSSQHQDRAWPNYLQGPILNASGQTINKTGTQPYLSTKMRW